MRKHCNLVDVLVVMSIFGICCLVVCCNAGCQTLLELVLVRGYLVLLAILLGGISFGIVWFQVPHCTLIWYFLQLMSWGNAIFYYIEYYGHSGIDAIGSAGLLRSLSLVTEILLGFVFLHMLYHRRE